MDKSNRAQGRRKRKIKTNIFYKGKEHTTYLSHVKVQITASRKNIYLVLVYGLTEHPMMLATNKEIRSKDDVIRIAGLIFSDGALRNISAVRNKCINLKISV